jgi:antitoxin HigA-1
MGYRRIETMVIFMAKEAGSMNNQVLGHNGNEIEIEAFHPGEFLKEEIEGRDMLKKDAAKVLNILPHHLSGIFAGKRNISAALAVKLERLLVISSYYWLGLQMEYDLFIAKQEEALSQ